ncbi:MAG: alternative ribosome rescue aminoacyl-tRNA hydrolase ArfB [Planctomycetaceae bacterium]
MTRNIPSVEIRDDELYLTRAIRIPREEFQFSFVRSSGPGGQNVNKVATKAQMRWDIANSSSLPEGVKQRFLEKYSRRISKEGEFLIASQRYRDQAKNILDCLQKLGELIASVAVVPPKRKKTKPSRASKERRLQEKKKQSARKQQRRKPIRED